MVVGTDTWVTSSDPTEEDPMNDLRHWTVDVYVGEDDNQTFAEAALADDIGNHLLGTGRARLSPHDVDVPEIGDEIAVGRALANLGHRLLNTAAGDIQTITHESVHLHT
jgi:Rv2632c-like